MKNKPYYECLQYKIKRIYVKIISSIFKKELAVDITGIILTPGNHGKNCKGNGKHRDVFGREIEGCCDECDYMLSCFPEYM